MPAKNLLETEPLRKTSVGLHCLYRVSEIVDYFEDDLERIIEGVAEIIRESMTSLSGSAVILQIGEYSFHSGERDGRRRSYEIPVRHGAEVIGRIAVECADASCGATCNSPNRDEIMLLNIIAERMGKIYARITTQHELKQREAAASDMNIVLREVMGQIEREKTRQSDRIRTNIEKVVLPLLTQVEATATDSVIKGQLRLIRTRLMEIGSEFIPNLLDRAGNLTLREQHLCEMIRRGMSSKEIAEEMHLSLSTVHNHRENIRHKLGLQNTDTNLAGYLQRI